MKTKNYIFTYFHEQYLVLFATVPRNSTVIGKATRGNRRKRTLFACRFSFASYCFFVVAFGDTQKGLRSLISIATTVSIFPMSLGPTGVQLGVWAGRTSRPSGLRGSLGALSS